MLEISGTFCKLKCSEKKACRLGTSQKFLNEIWIWAKVGGRGHSLKKVEEFDILR